MYKRYLVVSSVYSLLLAELIFKSRFDFYIIGPNVPSGIRKNFKPGFKVPPFQGKMYLTAMYLFAPVFKLFLRLFNFKAIGDDNAVFSCFLTKNYWAVEDGISNYTHPPSKRKWLLKFLTGIYFPYGYGDKCEHVLLTGYYEIPDPLKKKAKVYAFHDLMEDTDLLKVLNKKFHVNSDIFEEKTDYVLLTQPFYKDSSMTLEEHIAIYRKSLSQYADASIAIKPHPRDDIDYLAYFPNMKVFPSETPIELLVYQMKHKPVILSFFSGSNVERVCKKINMDINEIPKKYWADLCIDKVMMVRY